MLAGKCVRTSGGVGGGGTSNVPVIDSLFTTLGLCLPAVNSRPTPLAPPTPIAHVAAPSVWGSSRMSSRARFSPLVVTVKE
jgi:hypothetical protein